MHDLRWLRDHPAEFDRGLERRGVPPQAAAILALDRQWRAATTNAQQAQARRNRLGREIGAAKARGEDVGTMLREAGVDREAEAAAAVEAARHRAAIDEALAQLPNLPAADVPDGADETANIVL